MIAQRKKPAGIALLFGVLTLLAFLLIMPQQVFADDPNAFMANMADCMLVLLLGTIIALISYYNVDLTQVQDPDEIIGVEINMDEDDDGIIDDSYKRRGTVYYDEASGSFYYVKEGEGQ